MILLEMCVRYLQHKRIQAACIKSWMLSEACHICWSWAELLDQRPKRTHFPTAQALHHRFHGTAPPTQTPAKHSDTDTLTTLPLSVSGTLTVSIIINHEE
ncbi:unnamed protein product [Boreogadus saida]